MLVEINGKPRPAILVQFALNEGRATVLCGTGTRRTELAVIEVPYQSAAGKALRLEKDTYFYADQVRSVRTSHLQACEGHCSPSLFLQVRILVDGAMSALSHQQLTKDLAEGAAPDPIVSAGGPG
ncbi:hypothetical protein OWM54_23875 [Myxococcus sp. MISCRS1]|uniref:hypothetical protein n=1 Tax=Myxococcus sp. MISCRS1 TaxID=2996786 RepID=UPI00226FFF1B|nr:hypothetical protein [Myxococcus sp. MISCRS1]MCY1000182.1 hypothetical protein [Myxococcus sp. MISCRS1]